MPRWRTMIEPAGTSCPSPTLTPRRWPTLSRPFFELEPAFLCAMGLTRPSWWARLRGAGLVGARLTRLGARGGAAPGAAGLLLCAALPVVASALPRSWLPCRGCAAGLPPRRLLACRVGKAALRRLGSGSVRRRGVRGQLGGERLVCGRLPGGLLCGCLAGGFLLRGLRLMLPGRAASAERDVRDAQDRQLLRGGPS